MADSFGSGGIIISSSRTAAGTAARTSTATTVAMKTAAVTRATTRLIVKVSAMYLLQPMQFKIVSFIIKHVIFCDRLGRNILMCVLIIEMFCSASPAVCSALP